jgi:polyisoprenyl-teichoic acid--peptidoglycan teichoic acid transferase
VRVKAKSQVRRRRTFPEWVVWALAAAFILTAMFSAAVAYAAVRNLVANWSGEGLPSFLGRQGQGSSEAGEPSPIPFFEVIPEPWDGTDRVTILFMGLDYRDWVAGEGPPRTDSMMLMTIDPITLTGGLLSIPRDLWVEIPGGFEHNRINTAYFLGEQFNLPGGGPGLAMDTVENLLGVPISYYAVIDFSTFERMIDEIGGIDVMVFERVKIAPINGMSKWLEAKAHHLDGPDALAYARARKTEGGDFDRAARQQQVALAIRDRVLGFEMIPTLITKAPRLYNELASGIRTNLTLEQMVSLGLLAAQIESQDIRRGVIAPPDMVTLETLPDGAQVLRPVPDQIRILRDEIFTETGAIGPSIPVDDPVEAARLEAGRLGIFNGAGREGLATQTADLLRGQGMNVVQVTNADRLDYQKSLLIVYQDNFPYSIRYIAELLGLSQSQILRQPDGSADLDLAVILGNDWPGP